MKRWLLRHLVEAAPSYSATPIWLQREIHAFADPWPDQARWDMRRIAYREVKWPLFKPPAFVTLDDRALTFTGEWPAVAELRGFKPWNKA